MNLPRLLFRLALGRRLPITSGTLSIPSLEGAVTVRRDGWGIPHISAGSEADVWFGLGFCTAQDRAFQLELMSRVARGTLAELVGPEGLPIDRLSRRIGFVHAARQQFPVLRQEVQAALESYARGVNAGNTIGMRGRAHEFVFLRTSPTPWTALDVLANVKVISFLLATNWDVELARLKILSEDGLEALLALDPAYPAWQPVVCPPGVPAGPAIERLTTEIAAFLGAAGGGGASNNWALAASRTATGRPILADDPHLAATLPPHWYLAHLITPDWSVAGACFVGLPGVPVGHNGHAAWGVTVGMTDNTDLFVEEVGSDGQSVRQGDMFVPAEVREERIGVKGQSPEIERVLVTARGPIVGPALQGEVGGISLRATWLDPVPLEGLLGVQRVHSFDDFHRQMADWPALPLHMVYADAGGTIGWQLIGNVPRRRKGNGAIPLAGWDPEAGWGGTLPYEEVPHLRDPETGYVATANNRATRDEPFLTVDWLDGYRAERIVEVLRERHDWDLAGNAALQMDVTSLPWRGMRESVLGLRGMGPGVEEAVAILEGWDGRLAVDSAAATVFELFLAEMCTRVAQARAPKSWRWVLGESFHPISPSNAFAARRVGHLERLLREQLAGHQDGVRHPEGTRPRVEFQAPEGWFARSWREEMAEALAAVIDRLRREYGPNSADWVWGSVRPLTLLHLFGQRKPFDRIFNLGPFPWGGDGNTPSQAAVLPLAPTANPSFIASLRMVVDVGEWENSRFVLPGGQSGNPLSRHYADQLPLWLRGEGIPIPWSEEMVRRATRETLRLEPLR